MELQQNELNSSLLNIYINNLNFFEKSHPKIFEKIEKFSKQLEDGEIEEKYSLEFKSDGGYFDIYDIEKKEFIYGFNSYEEADLRKEKVDFTTHHSLNLLRINPTTNKLTINAGLQNSKELINFLNKKIDFSKIEFRKIFKFVFIGVGCGVHIHEIYKKIDSMNTLIIEPNLEIFRLSMFLIDYSIFEEGNKKLFLSVDENKIERIFTFDMFSNYHAYMNYNIKHHLFWMNYKYLLDELIDYYGQNYAGAFPHQSVLKVFDRTLEFFKNKYRFFQKDLVLENKPLKDKKVLLISAGPSLDSKIEWIKENQDKFVVVCVDVILRKLEKNGIVPDIVFSIDPSHLCAKYLTCEDKGFLKNSVIVLLSQQHEKVLETIKDLNFYFTSPLYISRKLGYAFSLANVGTFSFAFSLFLGANELYTIGNDAAFNQETGNRYASDSSHTQSEKLDIKKNSDEKVNLISQEDILEIKGNLRETIKTTRNLVSFKYDYEAYLHTRRNRDDLKLYNLSDGAYIEGLKPLEIENIDIDSLKTKELNFKEIFDSMSIDDVDDIEFDEDIKIINGIIQRLKKYKKLKLKNSDEFLKNKLDVTIWILEQNKKMEIDFFGNLFLKYINLIDIYINFTMNLKQKDLLVRENLEKIMNFWCDNSIELFRQIRDILEKDRF